MGDFDVNAILSSGGTLAACFSFLVWLVRAIGHRLDGYLDRQEVFLDSIVKAQNEIKLTLAEHVARDDAIQSIVLEELKRISPPSRDGESAS